MKKLLLLQAATYFSLNVNAQTQNTVFTLGQISDPNFEVVSYTGDLSVDLQNNGISWDQCLQKFKSSYKVTVHNRNGNLPFTFLVKFERNGQAIPFFVVNAQNAASGVIRVLNLGIGESSVFDGYIYHPQTKFADGPDIELKAIIAEARFTIGQRITYYKINHDLVPRNNISIASKEIPYLQDGEFEPSPFDNMNTLEMPATPIKIIVKSLPEQIYLRLGICNNKLVADPIYYGFDFLGDITFVKISCYDSKVPYYHIKKHDKYIAYNPFDGSVYLNDYPMGETSTWIFERAETTLGVGFRIYNAFGRTNVRLQIITNGDGCLRNQLFMKPPGTAVFADYEVFHIDNNNN